MCAYEVVIVGSLTLLSALYYIFVYNAKALSKVHMGVVSVRFTHTRVDSRQT